MLCLMLFLFFTVCRASRFDEKFFPVDARNTSHWLCFSDQGTQHKYWVHTFSPWLHLLMSSLCLKCGARRWWDGKERGSGEDVAAGTAATSVLPRQRTGNSPTALCSLPLQLKLSLRRLWWQVWSERDFRGNSWCCSEIPAWRQEPSRANCRNCWTLVHTWILQTMRFAAAGSSVSLAPH